MNKVDYSEILDLFFWGLDKLSRPTLHNLLAGYPEFARHDRTKRLIERLEANQLLKRTGRGRHAIFSITGKGVRLRRRVDPSAAWSKAWDGNWRLLMFDVPESRRTDRQRLWRVLRDRKFGFLQRSVWIWPHDLKPILQEIIQAEGIPEYFCGFAAQELLLCTDAEIVTAAWDFEEVERRHKAYEKHPSLSSSVINKLSTIPSLVAVARAEHQAYAHAFSLDPLLPHSLWPRGYRGQTVLHRHAQFRHHLARRLTQLAKK